MRFTTVAILVVVGVCVMLYVTRPKKEKAAVVAVAKPTNTTGRADTRSLEAASMVGYDGKAIRRTVDKTLNAADRQNKAYQEAKDP